MNILAANIGNTKTALGIFKDRKLVRVFSLQTAKLDQSSKLFSKLKVDAVTYAPVRPQAERDFRRLIRKYLKVTPHKFVPSMKLKVANPKEVGLDRIADCVAAYRRVKGSCIVVDCGTAITINFVDSSGSFCGGIIAPGVGTAAWALHERCALLPLVKITKPSRLIGKDTIENIKSGVWFSIKCLIESATKGRNIPVIGTGGDAKLFEDSFDQIIPNLALEGITER